jgi:hypothetical protein
MVSTGYGAMRPGIPLACLHRRQLRDTFAVAAGIDRDAHRLDAQSPCDVDGGGRARARSASPASCLEPVDASSFARISAEYMTVWLAGRAGPGRCRAVGGYPDRILSNMVVKLI